MRALELSHAANGIPGAVDSNDKTYKQANKRLQSNEEAGPSNAAVNMGESSEEDDESPAAVSSIPTFAVVDNGSAQLAKRKRGDKRKLVGLAAPLTTDMHADHKCLVDAEVKFSEARLNLVQWKIAHKKLQVFSLTKNMTPQEVDEAYALELTSEHDFLNGM
jgi:hypothetical protein